MKKYRINLNDLSKVPDPILEVYHCLDFDDANMSIEDLYERLIQINDTIVIELCQKSLTNDELYQIINCFENVQQKNDKVYLIHEVD
ncbi:hypothetical protein [Faecalitalea cylindroides]|uniref:hypothetical protein n=1 Tax=Faecalitalea cylindroides TaxID=39483 RepID=UPI00189877E8|nr:hypothetical protein [Faecalitalea cylindroides]